MRRSNRSGADLVVQVDNVSKSEVRVSETKVLSDLLRTRVTIVKLLVLEMPVLILS